MGRDFSLSATGELANIPLRLSLGYSDHDGILKGDNFDRKTASINFKPEAFGGDLKMSFNALYSNTNNTFANRGAIGNAISYDPTQSVFDSTSPYGVIILGLILQLVVNIILPQQTLLHYSI